MLLLAHATYPTGVRGAGPWKAPSREWRGGWGYGVVVRAVTNNKDHRGSQGLATERYNVCVVEMFRRLVHGRSKKKDPKVFLRKVVVRRHHRGT